MAKNIMISNEAYEKLKNIKGNDPNTSYSDAIISMEPKKKTFGNLIKTIEKNENTKR